MKRIIGFSILLMFMLFVSLNTQDRNRFLFGILPGGLFQQDGTYISTPVSVASAATTTLPSGQFFSITGTGKITRLLGGAKGRIVYLNSVTTDTLVDGVNLKLAGNFNGTADDEIVLMYNPSGAAADTFWVEISRSAN